MTICIRCGNDGAGSHYNGATYHLTCKLEQKLDDGVLGPTPEGVNSGEKKTTFKRQGRATQTRTRRRG